MALEVSCDEEVGHLVSHALIATDRLHAVRDESTGLGFLDQDHFDLLSSRNYLN